MGNFFGDVAGGFLGVGPGTDTVAGDTMLSTEQRQGLSRLRTFLADDPDVWKIKGYGGFFAPGYEALKEPERARRVEEMGNVYKAQFNPFLQDVMTRAEGDLAKSGLLTSGRSAYLKGKISSDLALQSMLPTVQYKHELEDVNRAETLRNQLTILDKALGVNYPNTVEVAKPTSMERGLGSVAGKAAAAYATGGLSMAGGGMGGPLGYLKSSFSRLPQAPAYKPMGVSGGWEGDGQSQFFTGY